MKKQREICRNCAENFRNEINQRKRNVEEIASRLQACEREKEMLKSELAKRICGVEIEIPFIPDDYSFEFMASKILADTKQNIYNLIVPLYLHKRFRTREEAAEFVKRGLADEL